MVVSGLVGPAVTSDSLDEWPIYLTDDGIVRCNQGDCDGQAIGDSIRGRRITFLEFVLGLQHHALVEHGKVIA